jgi:ATP-binding cassette subfamily B (MDR/TAP) protein 1
MQIGGIDSTASSIFTALLCVAFGGAAGGQIATAIEAFTAGRKALRPGVDVIARIPVIDSHTNAGKKLDCVDGNLSVKLVDFAYPARPDIKVCRQYSLDIKVGHIRPYILSSFWFCSSLWAI